MKEKIVQKIKDALTQLGVEIETFSVDYSADTKFGDFSSNVALVVAKKLEKKPHDTANQLRALLSGQFDDIEKIEIAGPGFINFFVSRNFIKKQIISAINNPDEWSMNDEKKKEVILFEYTSPNLFKPLHVGNLVGNIIGESISRLLENSGATVHRINYPSDIGLTVAKGVWGLQQTNGNPDDIHALGEAYRYGNDKYENDPISKNEIESVNRALYDESNSMLTDLRMRGIATSRRRLAELCRILGTSFDIEFFESQVSSVGKKIVENSVGVVFSESNGAIIFDGERYGLHTRVFINSQKLPTYEAKDLGNFILKQDRYPNWTSSMIVTGNEQTEYFKVLHKAINCLYPETVDKTLKHIPTGFLALTTGKMSSRRGNILSGESLLEEVRQSALEKLQETRAKDPENLASDIAVAALKYQILRQKVGANIVFDKQRALSFEGDSGPYLQYTHARIISVLKKAEQAGISLSTDRVPKNRYELENMLYKFPDIASSATDDYSPHKLITYLTVLASEFNTFYAREKIAEPSDEFSGYKIALTKTTGLILKRGLYLLGIVAPEKM